MKETLLNQCDMISLRRNDMYSLNQTTGQSHKTFGGKCTHSFWKLYLLTIQKNNGYINKMVQLIKNMSKFTPKTLITTFVPTKITLPMLTKIRLD
jgi:hypothetical protein